jgi:hypothetical protein
VCCVAPGRKVFFFLRASFFLDHPFFSGFFFSFFAADPVLSVFWLHKFEVPVCACLKALREKRGGSWDVKGNLRSHLCVVAPPV